MCVNLGWRVHSFCELNYVLLKTPITQNPMQKNPNSDYLLWWDHLEVTPQAGISIPIVFGDASLSADGLRAGLLSV